MQPYRTPYPYKWLASAQLSQSTSIWFTACVHCMHPSTHLQSVSSSMWKGKRSPNSAAVGTKLKAALLSCAWPHSHDAPWMDSCGTSRHTHLRQYNPAVQSGMAPKNWRGTAVRSAGSCVGLPTQPPHAPHLSVCMHGHACCRTCLIGIGEAQHLMVISTVVPRAHNLHLEIQAAPAVRIQACQRMCMQV